MSEESKYYLDEKTHELRSLILGALLKDIERIRDTIDDREKLTAVLSEVISASLIRANKVSKESSEALIDSLVPLLESAVQKSSSQSPQPLSDGLAPVMGPAISKAIRDAFRQMNENVNKAASSTLSPKAIGWRFKALFSNESFGDIVMRNTIEYQVKHVFLIHAKTGLLIEQVNDDKTDFENADMVSSMLTAIQDFVSDSFQSGQGQTLESVEVGNLTLWIERGAELIVAAAVFGHAPVTYREVLKSVRLRINRQFSYELKNFEGDTADFTDVDQYLKPCLVTKSKEENSSKKHWLRYVLLIILIIGGSYLFYINYERHSRWNKALQEIEQRKLALIIDEKQNWDTWSVKGILTGREVIVNEVFRKFDINPKNVEREWADISLYALYARVKNYLVNKYGLPDLTQVRLMEDTLFIESIVSKEVGERIRNDSVLLKDFGFSKIEISDKIITELQNPIDELVSKIESKRFYFERGEVKINETEGIKLRLLAEQINNLISLAGEKSMDIKIKVIGFADTSGSSELINKRISSRRAEQVFNYLVERGVNSGSLAYKGMGSFKETTGKSLDQSEQRVVMIKIENPTKP